MAAVREVVQEYVRSRPARALRGGVAGYSGYRQAGVAPARHRGLPSPYLTFVVTLGEPLVVAAHPDPRQPASRHRALLGGLHTAPALISHDGSQAGVQVALSPLAARALLGLPAGELGGRDVDAADVLGPVADELHERLAAAATWPERFRVVDDVLLRRAVPRQTVAPQVRGAWRHLLRTGGQARVADLVAASGWSARHLVDRFRRDIGLSPKAAARVVRFDAARRTLQAGRAPSVAAVAAEHGYADQAHLAREFRALAGCPPSTWIAEEVTNVQALPGRLAAGSDA